MSAYEHICTDTDCPFTGQRTDRGCKCHKTPEQLRDADIITLRQRVTDLLVSNNEFEQRARDARASAKANNDALREIEPRWRELEYLDAQSKLAAAQPRPISEYHEDMGAVLWWKFPIVEAPYVGSPNDLGFEVIVEPTLHIWTSESDESSKDDPSHTSHPHKFNVGGWPGYHTHFTPIPQVREP